MQSDEQSLIREVATDLVDAVRAVLRRPSFDDDPDLQDRLDESATGILTNITEAFEQHSERASASYLGTARAWNNDAIAHIAVACIRGHVTEQEYTRFEEMSEAIGKLLANLAGDRTNRYARSGR